MATVITKIQHRRGTAAAWASTNPVLASGEPGYETDTRKEKIGDGTTPWNSLPYKADGAPAPPPIYSYRPDAVPDGQPAWTPGTAIGQLAYYKDELAEMWQYNWDGTTWSDAVTARKAMSIISNDGSVMFTRIGNQVQADMNVVLDAPGGLMTHSGVQDAFYPKTYVDAMIAYLQAQITAGGGGGTVESPFAMIAEVRDSWEADAGVGLVSGAVDTWATSKETGNNWQAASAIMRPVYHAAGGPGDKPYVEYVGANLLQQVYNLGGGTDLSFYIVVKNTDAATIGCLIEAGPADFMGGADRFGIFINDNSFSTPPNMVVATVDTGDRYNLGGISLPVDEWMLLRIDIHRSKVGPDEIMVYKNGILSDMLRTNTADGDSPFFDSLILRMGGRTAAAFAKMGIAAMVIYKGVPSSGHNDLIENYLTSKYLS